MGGKKNISAPSPSIFQLYQLGLKSTELGLGVISAAVVVWAGGWENNPNPFKL